MERIIWENEEAIRSIVKRAFNGEYLGYANDNELSPFMAGSPHYVGICVRLINLGFMLYLAPRGCLPLVNIIKMGSGGRLPPQYQGRASTRLSTLT